MVFLQVLVDNAVEVIFDEEFGLSDGDESKFEGGDDIHALLGKPCLDVKTLLVNTWMQKH